MEIKKVFTRRQLQARQNFSSLYRKEVIRVPITRLFHLQQKSDSAGDGYGTKKTHLFFRKSFDHPVLFPGPLGVVPHFPVIMHACK